jgi:hypothetical protein
MPGAPSSRSPRYALTNCAGPRNRGTVAVEALQGSLVPTPNIAVAVAVADCGRGEKVMSKYSPMPRHGA